MSDYKDNNCTACGWDFDNCTCDGDDEDDDNAALGTALAAVAASREGALSGRATYELWVRHARNAGATIREIAKAAGVAHRAIQDILAKPNPPTPSPRVEVIIDGTSVTGDPAISLIRDGELDG